MCPMPIRWINICPAMGYARWVREIARPSERARAEEWNTGKKCPLHQNVSEEFLLYLCGAFVCTFYICIYLRVLYTHTHNPGSNVSGDWQRVTAPVEKKRAQKNSFHSIIDELTTFVCYIHICLSSYGIPASVNAAMTGFVDPRTMSKIMCVNKSGRPATDTQLILL